MSPQHKCYCPSLCQLCSEPLCRLLPTHRSKTGQPFPLAPPDKGPRKRWESSTYLILEVRMRPACCRPVRAMNNRRISLVPCGQKCEGQKQSSSAVCDWLSTATTHRLWPGVRDHTGNESKADPMVWLPFPWHFYLSQPVLHGPHLSLGPRILIKMKTDFPG